MMRSLWTAASGMIAQQTNVDVIANNLANVNTIGYKSNTAEFKSLLYQNIQSRTTTANGEHKPVAAQVGLGTRNSSISTNYKQGQMLATSNTFGYAISGEGFFAVRGNDGETYYTRNGNFVMAKESGGGTMLCSTDGYPVLDTNGNPIVFSGDITIKDVTIDASGQVCYPDENNNPAPTGVKIGLFQFANTEGLDKKNSSLLLPTEASGVPLNEDIYTDLKKSELRQGYLEGSNVEVAKEMVNLITAQRAYELNSKAIQATDDMLQQANQLKR